MGKSMSEIEVEQWRKDSDEARDRLRERFPDFRCVRCGNDNFLMRVWHDSTLRPAFSDDRIVEYICDNCGLVERHVVAGLTEKLSSVKQRIKDQNG
jgi:predicted RNA-binding Zn-ribbon protein involved in translation (DUF1610 family)